MKTTLEIPDDLMREVKIRAAEENRKLKDVVADLLEKGLAQPSSEAGEIPSQPVFPIFRGGHPAAPGEEMTSERLHEILLDQEVDRALGR